MIIALSFLGLSIAAGGLIGRELRSSPEGYEDEEGFHFVHRTDAARTGGFLRKPNRLTEEHGDHAQPGLRSAASTA